MPPKFQADFDLSTIRTIDDVLKTLHTIIDSCRNNRSRMGYFACLYLHVTKEIKERIERRHFDDPILVEKLDVTFAKRYLAAFKSYLNGEALSSSWKVAFDCNKKYWPIVIQHLLTSCAAHIELDLGTAVSEVVPKERMNRFHADFNRVNDVLKEVLDLLQKDLEAIWPPYNYIYAIAGGAEDAIINFSMKETRDHAWDFALRLQALPSAQKEEAIKTKDKQAAALGRLISNPPWLAEVLLKGIRLGETKSIPKIIDIMLDTNDSMEMRLQTAS